MSKSVALSALLPVALAFGPATGAGEYVMVVELPPLWIDGVKARARTQGLQVHDGAFHVTARRDGVSPRRALLLRLRPGDTAWDVWDITPARRPPGDDGAVARLYHPGGLDFMEPPFFGRKTTSRRRFDRVPFPDESRPLRWRAPLRSP